MSPNRPPSCCLVTLTSQNWRLSPVLLLRFNGHFPKLVIPDRPICTVPFISGRNFQGASRAEDGGVVDEARGQPDGAELRHHEGTGSDSKDLLPIL